MALPPLAAPVHVSVVPFSEHCAKARVGANVNVAPMARIAASRSRARPAAE